MDKQRKLKKIIAYLMYLEKVENQKDFAKNIDINVSNLSSAINGNKLYLTDALFNKIIQKFPEVDFITGDHSHNGTAHNTKNNNGGDNIYINNTGGSISNSGNTTGQQEAPGQHNGQGQEIKEMTKLLNQLHETKIIEIESLTKLYNGIISNQNEFIDTLKEQNSQYRKEIEYLRQKIKGYVEKSKKIVNK